MMQSLVLFSYEAPQCLSRKCQDKRAILNPLALAELEKAIPTGLISTSGTSAMHLSHNI